ncbi:hypothetical protein [Exiguobacterium alkaliphilum]|uniref:hypothetical protein n=1 Tax=Exiguobacterium alkaliphilum TaxID=1428684 RepID=UPI001BAA066D|nr:hypothetical protein [Exiguobacterium alkaliphilum]QUE87263.1 hypothetical protein KB235_05055 [Exiguobacterium alkaliphilum]
MIVRCSHCGHEQFVKDHKFDRHYRAEYETAILVFCDRRCCDSSQVPIPRGYIKLGMWLGGWSLVRLMTTEEYKAMKRTKRILEAGLAQMDTED